MNEADLKQRVLASVQRESSPPRALAATVERRRAAVALVVTLGLFAAVHGVRVGDRPLSLVAATALGAAAIALAVAIVALARGRSMLGRPRALVVAATVATPLSLLLWKLLWTLRFDVPGPTRLGLRCLGLSLAMAAAPMVVLFAARKQSDPLHPTATGAAIGATAGALAWLLVDLWCPVGYLAHLVVGHVLPLVVLIAVGAALGRRYVAVRAL